MSTTTGELTTVDLALSQMAALLGMSAATGGTKGVGELLPNLGNAIAGHGLLATAAWPIVLAIYGATGGAAGVLRTEIGALRSEVVELRAELAALGSKRKG